MALGIGPVPGKGQFTPATPLAKNQIRIGFDPKSINEVMSGVWGLGACAASTAYRYSREVALETYRQIVYNHPRDTRFSVRQIQVNYTLSDVVSARGERYNKQMSQWAWVGNYPNGRPAFVKRDTLTESQLSSIGLNKTRTPPYDDPAETQLARVRMLSGERHRGVLMPYETAEFKNWSKRKTIFVFSNARYERYLNYGNLWRTGLYYWENAFGLAALKANEALAGLGFDQSVISSQASAIDRYQDIVEYFIANSPTAQRYYGQENYDGY